MGYTHYWTLENGIESADWHKFLEGARLIIGTADEAGILIEDNSETSTVSINGSGAGNFHEDFVISSSDTGFNFCKTAGKPYDMVVTALLIHLKRSLKAGVLITSDGRWEDWESGRVLYETVFDVQPETVIS